MIQLTRQFALFKQTLVNDTRSIGLQLLRFLYIITISLMFIFISIQLNRWSKEVDGRYFFNFIFLINLIFVGASSLFLFLPIIREEKKENTLGIIMMTGISPFAYLLGKIGSRFFILIFMMAIQIPITYLCVTLGGISSDTILYSFLFLLILAFFLSNLFVLCSLIGSSTFSCLLIAFGIILTFSYFLNLTLGDALGLHYQYEPFTFFEIVLEDILGRLGVQEITLMYLLSLMIGGVIFFTASVFFFYSLNSDQKEIEFSPKFKGEKASKQKAENYSGKGVKRFYRKLKTKRFTNNPIIYKDFRFSIYGPLLYILQFLLIIGTVLVFLADTLLLRGYERFELYGFINYLGNTDTFFFFAACLFTLILTTTNQVFSEEISNGTLSALILLPYKPTKIFWDKTFCVLRVITPTLIMLLICISLCEFMPRHSYYYERRLIECYLCFPIFIATYFLNAWLSMSFKQHSFFLANGLTVGFFFLLIIILDMFRFRTYELFWSLSFLGIAVSIFSYYKARKKLNRVTLSS